MKPMKKEKPEMKLKLKVKGSPAEIKNAVKKVVK